MDERRIITIHNRTTHQQIAQGIAGKTVQLFEGVWYFDKSSVDTTDLIMSERTYVCPYKGVCYWIDMVTSAGIVPDVGFTYFEVRPGYEFIQDKIGFYAGLREATIQETAVLSNVAE